MATDESPTRQDRKNNHKFEQFQKDSTALMRLSPKYANQDTKDKKRAKKKEDKTQKLSSKAVKSSHTDSSKPEASE